MPIVSEIDGDLIALAKTGKYIAIAHGANCQNVMKSGIAPKIVKAFPSAGRADQRTVRGSRKKLGYASIGYEDKYNLLIYNLYTQYHWNGRLRGEIDLDYDALGSSFRVLNSDLSTREGIVGIPMIGSGLAGGDWDKIRYLIDTNTPDIQIEIVKYDNRH